MSSNSFSRRDLLALSGAATAAAVPFSWAEMEAHAQTTGGERVLRYGISMADIPQTTGQPDRGAGAYQFTGHTLYDPLVAWEMDVADRPGKLVPGLATSWEALPSDRTKWVFRLRPGVTFHDGSAFNADAVIWNFEKVLNTQAPHFDNRQAAQVRPRLPSVASYRKLDDMTVEVTTRTVDSFFPYQMLWFLISSPAQYERLGRSWDRFAQEPSGTGPFRLARLVPRERAELVRNPTYWNAARAPKLDRIVLIVAPETVTRTNAILTNQVDIIESPAPDLLPRLRQGGVRIIENVTPHVWNYHLSLAEGSPWRDLRLRQAANLAINRDEVVALLGGLAKPAVGVVDPTSPWFGNPSFRIRHDPAEARRLLAEAGYGPQRPLTIRVQISASGSGQMQPLSMNEFLQQDLRTVGVNVEFDVIEWNALFTNWRNGCGHASARGAHATNVSFSAMDPFFSLVRFYDSKMAPPVSNNWGMFNDPRFDAMVAAARTSFDPAERDAALARLHAAGVDEALFIWIAHDVGPRAMSPRVRGHVQPQSWFVDLRLPHIQ